MMNWLTDNPGTTYLAATVTEVIVFIVIADALVSIASSLKNMRKEK